MTGFSMNNKYIMYVLYIKPKQVKTWGIYVYDCIIAKIILTSFDHIVCKQCNNVSIILFPLQRKRYMKCFRWLCAGMAGEACVSSGHLQLASKKTRRALEGNSLGRRKIQWIISKKNPYVTFIVHVSHHINHNLYINLCAFRHSFVNFNKVSPLAACGVAGGRAEDVSWDKEFRTNICLKRKMVRERSCRCSICWVTPLLWPISFQLF